MTPLSIAVLAVGGLTFLFFCVVAVVSRIEREPRAAAIGLLCAILVPVPFVLVGLMRLEYQSFFAAALLILTGTVLVALLIPLRGRAAVESDTPRSRIDERNIMFSRWELEPGSERFEQYYAANPDKKPLDDEFRAKAGVLAKGASAFHRFAFPAADASFWSIERLRPFVDGSPAAEQANSPAEDNTRFVKRWTLKLGAVDVGVTRLQDYHKYTVVGRGREYGDPVTLDHKYAIALTVEMDKRMVDSAPLGPTAMESAQQYVECGTIAVQLADFIRRLGYPARAHIDGNYRVVCPLVARDAGLGEIGRMGLLMTPRLGPRVRIAVVTTDLPLVEDERRRDPSMIDFCRVCKKCADVCPSAAIPTEDRAKIDGVRRWQINQEACFTFWCLVGTDCARCMKVCPYSHPDNLLHNGIRWGVRNSALFARVALWLDDVFYGKRPKPADLPGWFGGEGRVQSTE